MRGGSSGGGGHHISNAGRPAQILPCAGREGIGDSPVGDAVAEERCTVIREGDYMRTHGG